MKPAKKKSQIKQQPTGIELPFGKRLHPLAEKVPPMSDVEFADLVQDIKQNGQRDPITVDYAGQVVDGRHRLLACKEAGVKHPKVAKKLPKNVNVALFIISRLTHRNLSVGQRAMIAADLLPDLSKLTKGARDVAAEKMNVSAGSVHEAQRLIKEDPEKADAVRKGHLKLHAGKGKKKSKADKIFDAARAAVKMPDEPEQEQEPELDDPDPTYAESLGADKMFGIWEQAHQYLIGFVSYIDKLDALGEDVADLAVGTRAMQKQFARLRKASGTGAVAVVS